ncbi:MAG: hypothetical protein IJ207_09240 [Treponema sp.]|uniref:hypothetical protein n=1 Tax=Treponema sp. TaxID=166 RepID=UPI0025E89814|nr:hypothetical protein [Treponema sp.]MBQ9282367.1 hypothetical protein [Treponema sp.]
MSDTIKFNSSNLESSLSTFASQGITEFTLQDEAILSHKGKLLHFLEAFREKAGDVFLTLPVNASLLDMDVCKACSELYCTLEIPLEGLCKGGSYLFDKKFFSRRAQMLNTMGLVFGFDMNFAAAPGDSVKAFRDRLDFALSLYPNHIDFPQLEADGVSLQDGKLSSIKMPKPSATFSTQDIKNCRDTAFALSTFYTYGRAVTWFLAVLAPLKMSASKFFQDFAEWQKINNCSLESPWKAEKASHAEIEKMQLSFLKFKYEEKNKSELFEVVSNVVRLNGALSRAFGEGEESEVELSYNPDELLSGAAMDIQAFFDNSFIENSTVKVFMGEQGPDYHYC